MTAVQTQRASAKPLILICGEEEYLKRIALKEIFSTVGIAKDDFDLEEFDGQSSAPTTWVGCASTSPFLADRRTVVVRHLLQCDFDKTKVVDFKSLPSSSLLILVADEEGGSDDRAAKLKTAMGKWEKAISAAGGAVLKFEADAQAAKQAAKEELARHGKKLSEKAAEVLVEMTGGSLSRSLEEAEKLLLYVGSADSITEREVRAIVVPSREWNVFRMTDAIVTGRVQEALKQLRVLIGSRSSPDATVYGSVLPMVSRNLRLLWQGILCIEAGCIPATAPPEVVRLFPEKPNLAREQSYRQNQVMASARKMSRVRITRAFQILADADARLKGGLPGFNSTETLERMILEMSGQ